jgi:hypothetical protein
VVYQ